MTRRTATAAISAGVLYFCGFAGIEIWPLSFVCLVPLLWLIERERLSGKHALYLGLLFGSVTNWGGYYWLIGMLQEFSGFGLPLCILFFLIICLYQGGQFAAFFWLTWRAVSLGRPVALAAPFAFMAAEYAYPQLFPNYFANSLHGSPTLIQIVDVGGPILLSGAMVSANVGLYLLLRARGRPGGMDRVLIAVTAALWLGIASYGRIRIVGVDARAKDAPSLTVGIVQANMGHFEKRTDTEEGLRRHIQQSVELERDVGPDLLIWPESAVGFAVEGSIRNLRGLMGPLNTPILFGGISVRQERDTSRIYNSAFLIDAQGNIQAIVDKSYLLAFGEYLPLGEVFPVLYEWSPNTGHFTPGRDQQPIEFGGQSISVNICYEDILPEFVRRGMQRGSPRLLVNLTNDSWFGDTTEPWIHLALAKFRAVEHHTFLVRATNSGVSAVVDPVGRVTTHGGVMKRASLHATVRLIRAPGLYALLGNWPGWLALIAVTFVVWRRSG